MYKRGLGLTDSDITECGGWTWHAKKYVGKWQWQYANSFDWYDITFLNAFKKFENFSCIFKKIRYSIK